MLTNKGKSVASFSLAAIMLTSIFAAMAPMGCAIWGDVYVELDPIENVMVGEPLVVTGTSNREDGSVIVITVEGPKKLTPQIAFLENGKFSATFDTTDAPMGSYVVTADDGDGHTDTTIVLIFDPMNYPPTANIDSITPNPAKQGRDTILFTGHGNDSDGSVVAYNWTSNIDGLLNTSPSFTKSASELSYGTHTIYFSVLDDDGMWSLADTEILTIEGAIAAPEEEWNRTFGGDYWDEARSVQQTTDGSYILVGSTQSYGAGSGGGNPDVWLVKTDANGIESWNRTFGGFSLDYGYSVQQTTDGGYILAGETYSYGAGWRDGWLVKTDSNGVEQWNRTFGGGYYDGATSVQQTIDGGYVLAGGTESYGAGFF